MSLNPGNFAQLLHITGALKIGLLAVILLFIVFLFVVVKQVRSMNEIITQTFFSKILTAIALILFFFGIALFAVGVVIL